MMRYQNELESLVFSSAQQEQLILQLLSQKKSSPKRTTRLSYRLIALVAAISLLVGALGAVSLVGLSPEFRALFGIRNQEQVENLGALPIEQIFKDKNGSGAFITVKEVVADQERLYLLMEFTAPDGVILPVPDLSEYDRGYWIYGEDNVEGKNYSCIPSFFADEACTKRIDVYGGYSSGSRYLPDDNPLDNRVLLLYTLTTDRGFSEDAKYCQIPNIMSLWSVINGASAPLLVGMDINVVIPTSLATKSYSFYGRCSVNLGGKTLAVVDNLSISPISVSLDLIIPNSATYDEAFAQHGPWSVYVLMRDGTQVAAQFPDKITGRLDEFRAADGNLFFRADHVLLTLEHPIDVGEIEDIVFVGDNDPVGAAPEVPSKIVHFLFTPGNFFNNTYWNKINKIWMATQS